MRQEHDLGGSFALGPQRVRRAGYGAMQLAGDGVFGPPRDRNEALRVLRAAVDAGVDHVDTAQFYGAGTVNELIREALYPYPDGLAIVSKVAARRDASGAVLRFDEPYQLRQSIEENLATLGVSRLAAVNLRMMVPAETPGTRFDAQLATLIKAREEGLIGGVGLSNVSREHLLRAVDQTEIACVQNLFNLADQRSGPGDACPAFPIARRLSAWPRRRTAMVPSRSFALPSALLGVIAAVVPEQVGHAGGPG
jgi:aryl-alcohol dehydrogenase-like predicted oxidoreductase